MDSFLWLSVVDVNHDGSAKIFLNNLRKRNVTRGAATENIYGDRGYTEGLVSIVLGFSNGKLQEVARVDNYYLNAVEFPKKGKILLGQMKGEETVGAFIGGVYEMALRGSAVVPTVAVPLPDRCNVFNCVQSDLKGDHTQETVLIDKSNRLVILSPSGDMMWQSDKIFGATTNSFEGKLNDRRFNDIDYYAIPSPRARYRPQQGRHRGDPREPEPQRIDEVPSREHEVLRQGRNRVVSPGTSSEWLKTGRRGS